VSAARRRPPTRSPGKSVWATGLSLAALSCRRERRSAWRAKRLQGTREPYAGRTFGRAARAQGWWSGSIQDSDLEDDPTRTGLLSGGSGRNGEISADFTGNSHDFNMAYPNKAALPAQAEWLDARRTEKTCWERTTSYPIGLPIGEGFMDQSLCLSKRFGSVVLGL
jgi:hypothetical protein